VCIDLFASYGIGQDAETGELSWGSALLALHAIDPFDVYIFGDLDPARTSALADRVDDTHTLAAPAVRIDLGAADVMRRAREFKGLDVRGPKCAVLTGDANKAVAIVKRMMPGFEGRRLALTMLDPYGVSIDWISLEMLAFREQMDLLMLFPEDVDLERNWRQTDRIDRYMPPRSDWQRAVLAAPRNRGRVFRELYVEGLKDQLGLKVGPAKPIRAHDREIYKLLYASRHEKGLEVWDHARRVAPNGQLEFPLTLN
jgi:three-Cys-motif partner protein